MSSIRSSESSIPTDILIISSLIPIFIFCSSLYSLNIDEEGCIANDLLSYRFVALLIRVSLFKKSKHLDLESRFIVNIELVIIKLQTLDMLYS